MKYKVVLEDINSIDEIKDQWTHEDLRALLEVYEFGDTAALSDDELKEFLYLAISEFEPQEAAARLLSYRLGESLNQGQIDQISNDMLKENVAEHYSDISFHARLFDINVFLYKAYNGKFPHAKASVITLKIIPHHDTDVSINKSIALRALATLIDDHAQFKRIFASQLAGEQAFDEAQDIAWYFKDLGEDRYQITTSDYWISPNAFTQESADVNLSLEP